MPARLRAGEAGRREDSQWFVTPKKSSICGADSVQPPSLRGPGCRRAREPIPLRWATATLDRWQRSPPKAARCRARMARRGAA